MRGGEGEEEKKEFYNSIFARIQSSNWRTITLESWKTLEVNIISSHSPNSFERQDFRNEIRFGQSPFRGEFT